MNSCIGKEITYKDQKVIIVGRLCVGKEIKAYWLETSSGDTLLIMGKKNIKKIIGAL